MHNFIKGFIMTCAMVSLHLTAQTAASAAVPFTPNEVKVQINDQLVQFADSAPFLDENARLQVPVRTISDKLGLNVNWQQTGEQIKVTISGKQKEIHLTTGDASAQVNGSPVALDTEAKLKDGSVYVPFRFISESMGIRVQWDPNNRIAILNEDGQYHAPAWYAPKVDKVIEVKATAYTGAANENGGRAAIDYYGNPLQVGTISVDPSVIPLGSLLYVEGYSYDGLPEGGMIARATDTGGSIKGNSIDIYVPDSAKKAYTFGIQNVKVYVLKQ